MKLVNTALFQSALAALAIPGICLAQATGSEGALASDAVMEEVIVTARRREESLQEIPLSVTTFAEQQIERRNIQGIADVAIQTPGLNYEAYVSAGQTGAPVMRGLTPTDLTNREQNVAVFLDGVYLPNQGMIDMGVLDLARVEVVKGPQSALYGRNAFAGAINYVTRRPSDELSASVGATFGSDEREDISLNLSGPIVPGTFYAKAAYGSTEFDGTWYNNHPNAAVDIKPGTVDNPGGWDNESLSLGLLLDTGNFEAEASYYRTEVDREVLPHYNLLGIRAQAFGITNFNDLNCNQSAPFGPFGPRGNSLYCGKLPITPTSIPGDPRLEGLQMDPRSFGLQSETDLITARARYEFSNFAVNYLLGNIDFSAYGGSLVDRNQVLGSNVAPFIGLPFPLYMNQVDARPISDTESTSHELRVESIGAGRLQWLGGIFRYEVEDDRRLLNGFAMPLGTESIAPQVRSTTAGNSLFEDEATALFGAVDFAVTDQWSARVEARYTWEEKDITRLTGDFGPVLGLTRSIEEILILHASNLAQLCIRPGQAGLYVGRQGRQSGGLQPSEESRSVQLWSGGELDLRGWREDLVARWEPRAQWRAVYC